MSQRQYIKAENIKIKFGDREIFHIDRLNIYEGEKVGLVGLNGAGKTTLLRVLAGEIVPDCGTVKTYCEPIFFRQFAEEFGGIRESVDDLAADDFTQYNNFELNRSKILRINFGRKK